MSNRREKAKEALAKQHWQLEKQEIERNRLYEQRQFYLKISDVLFDIGKLVFGGVLIGGLFESFEHPIWLYVIGSIVFIGLMSYGTILFKKGIKK